MFVLLNDHNTGGIKVIWICLGIAVMLHVVLAIVAIQPYIITLLTPRTPIAEKPVLKKNREVVISLVRPAEMTPTAPPEMVKKEPIQDKLKPELDTKEELAQKIPEPEIPKYARTSDDQLQGVVENTKLQGGRDTIAASSVAAKANAPDRAATTGDSKYKDREELVDTSYQDGSLEHMNKGANGKPTPPTPVNPPSKDSLLKPKLADQSDLPQPDPNKIAEKEVEEKKSSIEETPELGDALDKGELGTTDKNVDEFLETKDQSLDKADEVMKNQVEENKTIANKDINPDAMKQKAEKQQELASKPKSTQNKSNKGFRSEAKATVVEGSIFRRSKKGSANVKATSLGKYMAEVSRKIENEWQRRCMMHADLIQPGSVRMSFIVMPNGKVKHTRTLSKLSGSEAQFNLTYQAINSIKLSPMPAAVKKIQEGDPIEFRYSFSF